MYCGDKFAHTCLRQHEFFSLGHFSNLFPLSFWVTPFYSFTFSISTTHLSYWKFTRKNNQDNPSKIGYWLEQNLAKIKENQFLPTFSTEVWLFKQFFIFFENWEQGITTKQQLLKYGRHWIFEEEDKGSNKRSFITSSPFEVVEAIIERVPSHNCVASFG